MYQYFKETEYEPSAFPFTSDLAGIVISNDEVMNSSGTDCMGDSNTVNLICPDAQVPASDSGQEAIFGSDSQDTADENGSLETIEVDGADIIAEVRRKVAEQFPDGEMEGHENTFMTGVSPDNFMEAPRNPEDIDFRIIPYSPRFLFGYMPASDDQGELLGDRRLLFEVKTFIGLESAIKRKKIKNLNSLIDTAVASANKFGEKVNLKESISTGIFTKYNIWFGMLLLFIQNLVMSYDPHGWMAFLKKGSTRRSSGLPKITWRWRGSRE